MVEEKVAKGPSSERKVASLSKGSVSVRLSEVGTDDSQRISLHIAEVDRLLGGGLVRGSLVLIGGEPGIGLQRPHSDWYEHFRE